MPETEEVTPEPTTAKDDPFPELWTMRKIGRLMEDEPPEMRAFLMAWLNTRYGKS